MAKQSDRIGVVVDAASVVALLTRDQVPEALNNIVGRAAISAVALPTLFADLRAKGFADQTISDGVAELGLDVWQFGLTQAIDLFRLSPHLDQDLSLAELAGLMLANEMQRPLVSADPRRRLPEGTVDLVHI